MNNNQQTTNKQQTNNKQPTNNQQTTTNKQHKPIRKNYAVVMGLSLDHDKNNDHNYDQNDITMTMTT